MGDSENFEAHVDHVPSNICWLHLTVPSARYNDSQYENKQADMCSSFVSFCLVYTHSIQSGQSNALSPNSPSLTTPNPLTPDLAAGVALHATLIGTLLSSLLRPDHWTGSHLS